MARVLGAVDLWEVLEVPRAPALDVLKKAKRTKSLLVHPDKLPQGTAGAPQAFVRVTQVGAPTQRARPGSGVRVFGGHVLSLRH